MSSTSRHGGSFSMDHHGKGKILFGERGFVGVLGKDCWDTHCHNCHYPIPPHPTELFSCQDCSSVGYCSPECRSEALDAHRFVDCQVIPFLPIDVIRSLLSTSELDLYKADETLRLAVGLLCRVEMEGPSPPSLPSLIVASDYGNIVELLGRARSFTEAEDHFDDVEYFEKHRNAYEKKWESFLGLFCERANNLDFITKDMLRRTLNKIVFNSFSFHSEGNVWGSGFYVNAARFNHSCDPDLRFWTEGSMLMLSWAQGKEPKQHELTRQSLENLNICYDEACSSSAINLTFPRRRRLYENYRFWCECAVLSEDFDESGFKKSSRPDEELYEELSGLGLHSVANLLLLRVREALFTGYRDQNSEKGKKVGMEIATTIQYYKGTEPLNFHLEEVLHRTAKAAVPPGDHH